MNVDLHDRELAHDGFTILPAIMTSEQCASLIDQVNGAMTARPVDLIGAGQGAVVGGRNLMDRWSGWRALTETPLVGHFVRQHVGRRAGLVRILYFDKPPGHSWSLSMHQDRTIAVAQHQRPADPFCKPTVKAGVPHVEATTELLQRMLTLRLHLDPMLDENGPLVVMPGSHLAEAEAVTELHTVRCQRGDVFVMRPLLRHGSRAADQHTKLHRRVLHLEIAPRPELPADYRWHRFEPFAGKQPAGSSRL